MVPRSCNRQLTHGNQLFYLLFILTFMLMSNVVQEFDPTWFLPPTSYLRQWFEASDTFFPSDGER